MANLSMIKRGVIQITDADEGTSKDVALPSAVKTGSSFLRYVPQQVRHATRVQRGEIAVTEAATSPTTGALATAVDLSRARVSAQVREVRLGDARGATVKLSGAQEVSLEWLGGALAAGEDIVAEYEVVEQLPARQAATLRLLDEDTLRAEWDEELEAGESITIEYEVVEFDQLADMLLEIDFKGERALAELGVNHLQDLLVRDDMRNLTQYRLRTFRTKANLLAATPGIPDGDPLEDGEISRRTVVLDVDLRTNDRTQLLSTLDRLMDTPGITVVEEE